MFGSIKEFYPNKVFAESNEIFLYKEDYFIDEDICFGIMLQKNERKVGEIIFSNKLDDICGNVSYRIFSEYQGNNYAKKALILLAENIYNLTKEDLYISILPDNTASIKTAIGAGAIFDRKVMVPKTYRLSNDGKYKYANKYIIKNKGDYEDDRYKINKRK